MTSPRGVMTATGFITYVPKTSPANRWLRLRGLYRDDSGRIVEGERVVAFLDEEGEIETIDAEGNAKVVTPSGIVATADRLDYAAATDRPTCLAMLKSLITTFCEVGEQKSNLIKKSAGCCQTTLVNASQVLSP